MPLVGNQLHGMLCRANQHEYVCFGLSSPWSFSSRSGIRLLHAVVQPCLSSSAVTHFAVKCSASCSAVLRQPFPFVLGCSRPLASVEIESCEVVQETPHSLFLLHPSPLTQPAPPDQFSEHYALRAVSCPIQVSWEGEGDRSGNMADGLFIP